MKIKAYISGFLLLVLFITGQVVDVKGQAIDTAANKLSLDLGWTRGRNVNLWPIFKRTRTKDEVDLQVFFSVYRKHMFLGKHQKHSHLFPVYWHDSSSTNRDLRLLSFYYPSLLRFSRNDSIELRSFKFVELAPKISLLEVTRSKDGLQVQNNFFFFIFYNNDVLKRKSAFVVFPLYWYYTNKGNYSHTLFPLFSSGTYEDSAGKYLAVTPLFWHFKHNDWHRNVLFPIWWNTKHGSGDSMVASNIIFPVYWHYRDKLGSRTTIFPLLWIDKNKHYHSFTLAPLFSEGHSMDSAHSHRHLVITPLFWHIRNNGITDNLLFPIYWHHCNGQENYTLLFPLLYKSTSQHYQSFTLFPLFSAGHSTDSARTRNYYTITPLFWHIKDGNYVRNIFFPLWWDYKTKDFHRSVVFPLIWINKEKSKSSFTFFPLFRIGNDDNTRYFGITPFFRHSNYANGVKVKNILFPLWWYSQHKFAKDTVTVNTIFPIYWSKTSKDDNYRVLFPLIWSYSYRGYRSLTIMPFFSYGHSSDTLYPHTRLAVTPFFWHIEKPDLKRNILFPIWWDKTKGKGKKLEAYQVLFPIYWKYDNPYRKSFAIMPFFSIMHSKDSLRPFTRTGITPIFWHYEWKYRTDSGTRNLLFPLWWNKTEYSRGGVITHNIVFPIYWAHSNSWGTYNVLFPIVWSYKMKYYHSFTFFPLFSYGHSTDSLNKYRHLAITPLYWSIKNDKTYKKALFPLWWYKKTENGENSSISSVVFPLYWSRRQQDDKYTVLFPFYWSFEDKNYKSLTVFPLFSYRQSKDSARRSSHLAIAPFYWHSREGEISKTVLFPFCWHKTIGAGENKEVTNYIFPLYWAHSEKGESKKVLFPLIWSYKDYYYRSFTFAPLFSFGRSSDSLHTNRYQMITPLFWHFNKNGIKRTVLFPVFNSYTSVKDNERRFNAFFILLRYKQKQQRIRYSFLWPLCEFVKDSNYKYFRFAPIIWYQHSKNSNYFSIQPFYYHGRDSISEKYQILWQLYTCYKKYNVKQSNNILWQLVSWGNYKNGDHEFRIMYRLFANVAKDSGIEKSFFPFYFISRQKNGDHVFSSAFGLYHKSKHKIENTHEYYQEIKILWFVRILSNYKALKAKGITRIR